MSFASLRARLPDSRASFISTLSGLPSAAASSWSQTIRGGSHLLGPELRVGEEDEDELNRADEVLGRLIYTAGQDGQGRPIVCIAASMLPDPAVVPHDLLLSRITTTLQSYVQQDYVLVFFAAGGKHYPPFAWFWSAWSSLGRSFRKNLKKLYLVHPTFFTKMLFTLAAPLVSPKFFRKIDYRRTLSDLAEVVPLQQVLIPPETFRTNMLLEQGVVLPSPLPPHAFHLALSAHMPSPSSPLPKLVTDCTIFLRSFPHLLATEGLFRKSPSRGLLRCVEEAYDRGSPVDLAAFGDSHLAAVLLKTFFRELKEPLLDRELYDVIRVCPRGGDNAGGDETATYIKERILSTLSSQAQRLLAYVVYLLHDVSLLSASNRMSSTNLAIVFTPNLVRSDNAVEDAALFLVPSPARLTHPDAPVSQSQRSTTLGEIVRFMIDEPSAVFPEEWRGTGIEDVQQEKVHARRGSASGRSARSSGKRSLGEGFFDPPAAREEQGDAGI